MRRHLPVFLVLAIVVMAPAVYLFFYASESLPGELALAEAEERAIHEQAASAIAARIRKELGEVAEREKKRKYYEYNYYFQTPAKGQLFTSGSNQLTYNVSDLAGAMSRDPRVNGYIQWDGTGQLKTPEIQNNPSPRPEQVEQSQRFVGRLKNFARLHQQIRKQAQGGQQELRCDPVDRQTFDANRNSKQWAAEIQKANKGDVQAQQEIVLLNDQLAKVPQEDVVPVYYSDFYVYTLDVDPSDSREGAPREPIVLAIRRVEERDEKAPRAYYQGFELNLDYLKAVTFPQAIAAVPAPNFAAHVTLRSSAGDRSIVRDLGRFLPAHELRAGPASRAVVRGGVEARYRRFYLALVVLATVIAGALFLFWRLLAGEVELGRRRQDFVSAVTHELKTPLTSIRMYAELLEDRWVEDPEKQREYYATIRSESERLSRLITNVLDFSRLERGRRALKLAPVDAAAVARDVVKPLQEQAAKAGGRLVLEAPESFPPFPLDRDALTQILINLVDNAIKYGAPGGRIAVKLEQTEHELVVTVDNPGENIPREDRKAIFQDFRRGKGRRCREVSGVGLGLALVRRFARAHGGTASCLDPERPGARFQVTFRRLSTPGNGPSTD